MNERPRGRASVSRCAWYVHVDDVCVCVHVRDVRMCVWGGSSIRLGGEANTGKVESAGSRMLCTTDRLRFSPQELTCWSCAKASQTWARPSASMRLPAMYHVVMVERPGRRSAQRVCKRSRRHGEGSTTSRGDTQDKLEKMQTYTTGAHAHMHAGTHRCG